MIKDKEEIEKKMKEIGYVLNPKGKEFCSFKIIINNCKETTYYFVEEWLLKTSQKLSQEN